MKLVYYDIETAGITPTFQSLLDKQDSQEERERLINHWGSKCKNIIKNDNLSHFGDSLNLEDLEWFWSTYAALYPEWGRVVCISYGYFYRGEFKMKSLWGEDEYDILYKFNEDLCKFKAVDYFLCGYNIKAFDNPYTGTRMLFNGIIPVFPLNVGDAKPWEVKNVDLVDSFKFGGYSKPMKFDMVCFNLGVESPKDDIGGADVHKTFWFGDRTRIVTYCEKDVYKTAEVHLKLIGDTETLESVKLSHC